MNNEKSNYEKVLSRNDLLYMSLSATIGVGVFIIIGHVSKSCKNYSWLAMLLAGIFALLTAFSYAELSSTFNTNSTEYEYIKYASGNQYLASASSFIIIFSELLILATIAIGLGHYCCDLMPKNLRCTPNLFAVIAIIFFNLLNYSGVKLSAEFSKYALFVKVSILILLIYIGVYNFKSIDVLKSTGVKPAHLIEASTFALFSYVGFTAAINLTEEAQDEKDIPFVIIATTVITIIIYLGVTITLLIGLGSEKLSSSNTPLSDLSLIYFGKYGYIIFKALAIVALSDTLLMTSIMESRYIHSLIENYAPSIAKKDIDEKTRTPYISIFIVTLITVLLIVLFKSIEKTSIYSDLITISMFIVINIITIILRFDDENNKKRTYTMPLNIKNIPIPSLLGAILGVYSLYNYYSCYKSGK